MLIYGINRGGGGEKDSGTILHIVIRISSLVEPQPCSWCRRSRILIWHESVAGLLRGLCAPLACNYWGRTNPEKGMKTSANNYKYIMQRFHLVNAACSEF